MFEVVDMLITLIWLYMCTETSHWVLKIWQIIIVFCPLANGVRHCNVLLVGKGTQRHVGKGTQRHVVFLMS